jgi:hypothetical protein
MRLFGGDATGVRSRPATGALSTAMAGFDSRFAPQVNSPPDGEFFNHPDRFPVQDRAKVLDPFHTCKLKIF